MREVFGTLSHRAPDDPALVLAVQNFKGGVVTMIVSHLAQYFALKGYRVCVIDCDSQASSTAIFGMNFDVDVDEEEDDALPFPAMVGPKSLHYALRATGIWPDRLDSAQTRTL